MRTLAFDGRMGASGDMLLAALLAAGADRDALAPVADAGALDVAYEVRGVTKNGISATAVDVVLTGEDGGCDCDHDHAGTHEHSPDPEHGYDEVSTERHHHDHASSGGSHDHSPDPEHGHDDLANERHHHAQASDLDRDEGENDAGDPTQDHGYGHEHGHDHEHGHGHDHDHTHAEGHGPSRTYEEVIEIVEGMDLPGSVASDAKAVFEILGEAEAAVHGTDLPGTQFHEVGADDAIADVVGACLLVDDLDVERVVTTPLATGGGEVSMSHGTYPVPTPSVVEIAERADWSLRGGPVDAELLTPTGAAILAQFAEGVETLPALAVERSGYGAGGYDFPEHPNVLRAIVGDGSGGLRRDAITVLETNLDDAAPEVLGGLQEMLADAGALDISVVPLTMKKSRPGHLVKVIVKPEDAERVARRLAEETGTLGVREHGASHRWIADREVVTATVHEDGERHSVGVKVASDSSGGVYDVSAEYDDALAVAREVDLPVREVATRAEAAVREGRTERLVHVVDGPAWEQFVAADAYAPDSLDEEGFVHCSTPAQVLAVAQYHHADDSDPKLLVIDPGRVDPDIRYEEQADGGYAHVYGPVNSDAIVDVLDFPREDGQFVLPPELE